MVPTKENERRADAMVRKAKELGWKGARKTIGANWRIYISDHSYNEGWKRFGAKFLPIVGAVATLIATIYGGPAAGAAVGAAVGMGTKAIEKSQKSSFTAPATVPSMVAQVLPAAAPAALRQLAPNVSMYQQPPLDMSGLLVLLSRLQAARSV